jgi:two-component system, OmpR family, alkaline phosphatase synthesis response regulator PhoP
MELFWWVKLLLHLQPHLFYCRVNHYYSMGEAMTSITPEQKKRILIAEDDGFYAKIFQDELVPAGYETIIAENGELALAVMRTMKPDILLLDMLMPVKDGLQTLKEIRSDEMLKDLKVIVISAVEDSETFKQCEALGVISYIPKTHSFGDAVQTVKQALLGVTSPYDVAPETSQSAKK